MENETRKPHAALDFATRNWKALKLERLLGLHARQQPLRLLEVGTGYGGIAHYFAAHPTLRCEMDAVYVVDNQRANDGYRYQQVEGVELPFATDTFDVVISNHVIEHVGDAQAQTEHLREIHRVMRPNGMGYLAAPNRWMLTEPHYRLKFLSWWPRRLRSPYLRMMGKGMFYDCEPLQMRPLERMLETAGFRGRNLCVAALRETFEIERPESRATRLLRQIPVRMLPPLQRIIPTLIYRIERATQ